MLASVKFGHVERLRRNRFQKKKEISPLHLLLPCWVLCVGVEVVVFPSAVEGGS